MPELTYNAGSGGEPPSITLGNIRFISIQNIALVQSHRIMRVDSDTVHEINMQGGGSMYIRYSSADGAIREWKVQDLEFTYTSDNDVVVKRSLVSG